MAGLAISLATDQVPVMPGSVTTVRVDVRNLGTVVDRYRCELLGMDRSWWTVSPASLELFPQRDPNDRAPRQSELPSTGRFTITIHPPRTPAARAGDWPIGAMVSSEHEPTVRQVEETRLTLLPFGDLRGRIHPSELAARSSAASTLVLENMGNRTENVTIFGSDPAEKLRIQIDRPATQVEPGQTSSTPFKVSGGNAGVAGSGVRHAFSIEARPANPDVAPILLNGSFIAKPLISSGVPVALAIVAALALGAAGVYAMFSPPGPGSTAPPTFDQAANPTLIPPPTAEGDTAAPATTVPPPTDTPIAPPIVTPTPVQVIVANYICMPYAAAVNKIKSDGFLFTTMYDGSTVEGDADQWVKSQDPPPGSAIAPGGMVTITVTEGVPGGC
jgi:hypothetical protein